MYTGIPEGIKAEQAYRRDRASSYFHQPAQPRRWRIRRGPRHGI